MAGWNVERQYPLPDGNTFGTVASPPDFGIDLANPLVMTVHKTQTDASSRRLDCSAELDSSHQGGAISASAGSIDSMIMPAGWRRIETHGAGDNLRIRFGEGFVPPDACSETGASTQVQIRVGPGLERVTPSLRSNLEALFAAKPAGSGPQKLTEDEFRSVAGAIAGFDGGNNQYHQMSDVFPKFTVSEASTLNVNGRTGLLVTGSFTEGPYSGITRRSVYFLDASRPGREAGLTQVYLAAPAGRIGRYEKAFENSLSSVTWRN